MKAWTLINWGKPDITEAYLGQAEGRSLDYERILLVLTPHQPPWSDFELVARLLVFQGTLELAKSTKRYEVVPA